MEDDIVYKHWQLFVDKYSDDYRELMRVRSIVKGFLSPDKRYRSYGSYIYGGKGGYQYVLDNKEYIAYKIYILEEFENLRSDILDNPNYFSRKKRNQICFDIQELQEEVMSFRGDKHELDVFICTKLVPAISEAFITTRCSGTNGTFSYDAAAKRCTKSGVGLMAGKVLIGFIFKLLCNISYEVIDYYGVPALLKRKFLNEPMLRVANISYI